MFFFNISVYDSSQCDFGPILASMSKVSKVSLFFCLILSIQGLPQPRMMRMFFIDASAIPKGLMQAEGPFFLCADISPPLNERDEKMTHANTTPPRNKAPYVPAAALKY